MARNDTPDVPGLTSNIPALLKSGHAQSLDQALKDEIPERAHIQSLMHRAERSKRPELREWEVRERGGSLEVVSGRTKTAHPRALKLYMLEPEGSPFWINLVIACDGPVDHDTAAASVARTSKSRNRLPNALNDLSALSEFYRPIMVGDPHVAIPGGVGRSDGFFSRTVVLANPTPDEVRLALDVLLHWVQINSDDPEFERFKFNVFYSGHAHHGDSLGRSCLFLGKTRFPTESLVESLLESTRRLDVIARCERVNLFLDSCYSAAVARDFLVHLQQKQDKSWRESTKPLYACGRLYCSSLDDEESFDETGLGHSYFVAAYLRENSSGKVSKKWPYLHEIGRRTSFAQNPVMVSVEHEGLRARFPSLQLLRPEAKVGLQSDELRSAAMRNVIQAHKLQPGSDGFIDMHPIDLELATVKLWRETVKNSVNRLEPSEVVIPSYDARVHRW